MHDAVAVQEVHAAQDLPDDVLITKEENYGDAIKEACSCTVV